MQLIKWFHFKPYLHKAVVSQADGHTDEQPDSSLRHKTRATDFEQLSNFSFTSNLQINSA